LAGSTPHGASLGFYRRPNLQVKALAVPWPILKQRQYKNSKDLHNQIRRAVYAFLLDDPTPFTGYADKIGLDNVRIRWCHLEARART
jgi:hypothetical protein